MENYPGNSRRAQAETRETKKEKPEKKIEKIVSGSVVVRKKPFHKRFLETFTGGSDASSVMSYIVQDVLVPAAKDTIQDAVSQGMERALFGDVRGRGSTRSRASSSYTSYNRYSASTPLNRREEPRREQLSRRGRATHNLDEIILETKAEAEGILDQLFNLINEYDEATLADLYEMLDLHPAFTDVRYGWTDLRNAGITRVRGGYLLDLPRPITLD